MFKIVSRERFVAVLVVALWTSVTMATKVPRDSARLKFRRTSNLQNVSFASSASIDLEFSLWHPFYTAETVTSVDNEEFVDPVLHAVQDFFCLVTDFEILEDSENVCEESQQAKENLFSTLLLNRFSVVIRDGQDEEEDHLSWTSWFLTYEVLNSSDHDDYQFLDEDYTSDLNNQTQILFDENIMDGTINELLSEYGPYFVSTIGNEVDTFLEIDQSFESESNYDNSFDSIGKKVFRFLRWLGILMVVGDVICVCWFSNCAERRTRDDQIKEGKKQKEEMGGLVSEKGLDHILAIGRRESVKIMREEYRKNPESELFSFQSTENV